MNKNNFSHQNVQRGQCCPRFLAIHLTRLIGHALLIPPQVTEKLGVLLGMLLLSFIDSLEACIEALKARTHPSGRGSDSKRLRRSGCHPVMMRI